jgi:hypothetical protein
MDIKKFNEFFYFEETPKGDVTLNVFRTYSEWLKFYNENMDILKKCYWSFIPKHGQSEKYFNMYVVPGTVFAVVIDRSSTPEKLIGSVVKDGAILHSYDEKDRQIQNGEFQKYLSMLGMDIEDVENF